MVQAIGFILSGLYIFARIPTFSISLKQSETSVRYVAASLGSPSSNNCLNMTISFSNRTAFSRLFFVQTLNADHKIITTAILSMSIQHNNHESYFYFKIALRSTFDILKLQLSYLTILQQNILRLQNVAMILV